MNKALNAAVGVLAVTGALACTASLPAAPEGSGAAGEPEPARALSDFPHLGTTAATAAGECGTVYWGRPVGGLMLILR